MANRSLLHRSKIEDFKSWLQEDGWQIEQPKGIYEVVRATKGTRKPLGKFYRIEGKTIIAVDNSTGDAWTEEFTDFETFLLWITTQLTVEEAEEIIKGRGNKGATTKCVGIRN